MSDDKSIPISPAALEAFAQGGFTQPAQQGASVTQDASDRSSAPQASEQSRSSQSSNESLRASASEESEENGAIKPGTETVTGAEVDVETTVHDAASEDQNVDPRYPITVLPGFCTRLAGSDCERCLYVCPYEAISFDPEGRPLIDAACCTRCGLCCGICDTFVTERITMNDLVDKVRRLSADGEPVFFTCYDQIPEDFEVHPNVIVLPCIGSVAPEFWTTALKIAPNAQIYCNFALCEDCPTAGSDARDLFTHAVNLGEVWSQVHMGRADRLPEKADLLSRFFDATAEEYQRRGIATSLVNEVEDIASGRHRKRNSDTLNNFHTNKEHLRAQGHAKNLRHHQHIPSSVDTPLKKYWPRLRMIAQATREHPEIAENIPRYLAAVDQTACAHCYEPCFTHCPAGARSLDEAGSILVDVDLCIACGNCVRYCPNEAAYLFETDASIFLSDED